jgi:hypothetical protein
MSSAAPGVLDYLIGTTFPTALAGVQDAVTGSGVTIWFGPSIPKFTTPITLQVHGVRHQDDWAEIGPNFRYEETAEIPCTITSWSGDPTETQAWLDRKNDCYNALSLITVNIANDPTLGGAVRWVRFQTGQFMPAELHGAGSLGHLDFTLGYRVRVSSLTSQANVY